MAVAAEQPAEIARNRPDISSLAAFGLENRPVRLGGDEIEPVDDDFARDHLDRDAFTREVIGALARDLDRRIGRRRLADRPDEPRQQRQDRLRLGTPLRR